MDVADVPGVNLSGLIFDAGPTSPRRCCTIGTEGSTASHAARPDQRGRRVLPGRRRRGGHGGDRVRRQRNYSIIDDVWTWRADHGAGAGTWTGDHGRTGLVVNGNNVDGLRPRRRALPEVRDDLDRPGRHGDLLPEREPVRGAEPGRLDVQRHPGRLPGRSTSRTRHHVPGYGMGSYSFFNQGVAIENAMAFQAPTLRRAVPRHHDRVPERFRRHPVGRSTAPARR